MSRLQSRFQRETAFLKLATGLHAQLKNWYDQHPAANFGEIEAEARRRRRELKGAGLTVLINGCDTGFQLDAPACPQCAQPLFPPGSAVEVTLGSSLEAARTRLETGVCASHVSGAL